jgi:hypothetical protein
LAVGDLELSAPDWILIIDDEFDIVTILRQGLEKQGFRAFGFTEPLLAIEHFRLNYNEYVKTISKESFLTFKADILRREIIRNYRTFPFQGFPGNREAQHSDTASARPPPLS